MTACSKNNNLLAADRVDSRDSQASPGSQTEASLTAPPPPPPPAFVAVAVTSLKSTVAGPTFGEHYQAVRQMSAKEAASQAAWKAPTTVPAHLASLFNILQVLTKKGLVSPRLTASFAAELKSLTKILDKVSPKSFARANGLAGKVFNDYLDTCMGTPENYHYEAAVDLFLARQTGRIGEALAALMAANADGSWCDGRNF